MDYQPLHTNRVDFNKFDPDPVKQNLRVNVIIVDNSNNGVFPKAYQFRYDVEYSDETFSKLDIGSFHVDSDSFINLGDIDTIHKKGRVVILRNGNTVSYNHLIIISDKKNSFLSSLPQHEEFLAAYCTLIDAVKTQKKLPSHVLMEEPKQRSTELGFKSTSNLSEVESTLPLSVRKALLKQFENKSLSQISRTYTNSGKLLVELQV
ncbi:MAG: hypothetical protein AAGG81_04545 [Chlamydiota bacterium]